MRYGFARLTIFLFTLSSFFYNADLHSKESEINPTDKSSLEKIQESLYILGPGDIVAITFLGANELSSRYQILSDGNVQLPLVGSQSLSGLTLNSAREKLVKLFSEELIKPEINLNIEKIRPIRVSLSGEVNRPGVYSLGVEEFVRVAGETPSINFQGFPTVVDAIQKAGGLTLDADITELTLYRKLSGNKNEFKKVNLNLLDLIKSGNQINNPNLFDGDIIKIPKQIDNEKNIRDLPNNLTPENINIYVVGQVNNPGKYQVPTNTSLKKAILIAGGPSEWKYQKNIRLLRVKRNGQVMVKKVKYSEKTLAFQNKKTSLQDGDIIQIKKNLFGKASDALGTFAVPLRDMYSLYGVYKIIDEN